MSELNIGIVGLGFMGRTHLSAYTAAAAAGYPCRVAAVADRDVTRFSDVANPVGNISTGAAGAPSLNRAVKTFPNTADLLADPSIDAVSICTHTDTHVDLALAALAAGKHVLLEKPVALSSNEVLRIAQAADRSGKVCLPAMCMRFWPQWSWLRDQVVAGTHGGVRTAMFQRLGSGPNWAAEFYKNEARSGGALIDLHIHDADFICWCFGMPDEVVSTGTLHHVTTIYRYESASCPSLTGARPRHVVAEGGWDQAPGFPFRMRYTVNFESATADFDLTRTPPLLWCRDGAATEIDAAGMSGFADGYAGQVRHFVELITGEKTEPRATLAQAAAVMRLLEAERLSLESGNPVGLRNDP